MTNTGQLEVGREYIVGTEIGDHKRMRLVGREIRPIDSQNPRYIFGRKCTDLYTYDVLMIPETAIFEHSEGRVEVDHNDFGFKSLQLAGGNWTDDRCWDRDEWARLNQAFQ